MIKKNQQAFLAISAANRVSAAHHPIAFVSIFPFVDAFAATSAFSYLSVATIYILVGAAEFDQLRTICESPPF